MTTTVSHTHLSGGAGARSALMPRSSTDRPRLETIRAEEVLEDDARPTPHTHRRRRILLLGGI